MIRRNKRARRLALLRRRNRRGGLSPADAAQQLATALLLEAVNLMRRGQRDRAIAFRDLSWLSHLVPLVNAADGLALLEAIERHVIRLRARATA